MNLIDFFLEPLSYDFMVRALATTLIASIVCAVLSCWLVLIGWSLMGDAVSHAVLPGVVLAYIVGAPFALGAVIFGFLAVALIGAVRDTSRVKEDAAIGIVFTTLFALGLVLISVTPSQTDLNHIIFGNLLGVSWADLTQVIILGAITFAILVTKRRDFTLVRLRPHPRPRDRTEPEDPRRSAPRPPRAHRRRRPAGGRCDPRRGDAHHPRRDRLPAHRPVRTHARHRPRDIRSAVPSSACT